MGGVLPLGAAAGSSPRVVTSTARRCAVAPGGPSLPGSVQSVSVAVGHGRLVVRFVAKKPWRADLVERSGSMQWEFVEWVPHHRPILEDNHGGTEFQQGERLVRGRLVVSRAVYFTASGRSISGSYRYSPTALELSYPLSRLAALGVRTPFTWSASYGDTRCGAVIEP